MSPHRQAHSVFLRGGGTMGGAIRAFDWASTPLGAPDAWPPELKTAVGLMLGASQPIYIAYGPELTSLYNDGYLPIVGTKHPDGLGAPFSVLWAEIWDTFRPIVEATLAGDAQHFVNLPIPLAGRPGVEVGYFTFSYTALRNDAGEAVGFYCAATETTDQVTAEERRAADAQRLQLTLQHMPGFVGLLSGPEHRYDYVNDAYVTISGPRDFLGRTVREVFPELEGQRFFELLDRVYATGEPFALGGMPIIFDETEGERFIDLLYAPMRDDAGEISGIFVGGHDVTERVRAERALAEANLTLESRVEERTRELSLAEEALRQAQKMEAVGQLTGGLAHDFNNLLAGISGSLELIRARMAQGRIGELEKYVVAAEGAATRAAALTHRLLAFSRRQTLAPKPTDVKLLVSGMTDMIARTVGPAINLETVHAADLWPTLIDPSQLENAILNLCINSRDAMPAGGKITIETTNCRLDRSMGAERGVEPGHYVSLCVSDTGAGMSPETASKAFDPFFTTKPIGMGTGLGLSMIYGFARQSGGSVNIHSGIDKGTTVCIYLPRHRGDAAAPVQAADLSEAPRGHDGETVLIVDDEPTVRMLVSEILADLGYTAVEAEDGAAGLNILRSSARIDLVVTDVGLPGGMNGRQMADAGRLLRPELRVLFITGYAENAVLSDGDLDPGMHVMTKPFSMEALASRIRALIGR